MPSSPPTTSPCAPTLQPHGSSPMSCHIWEPLPRLSPLPRMPLTLFSAGRILINVHDPGQGHVYSVFLDKKVQRAPWSCVHLASCLVDAS